ncbi:hypothetical protein HGG82_10220 [Marinomonas sp. M1K-6]|uniref:DUF2474 domain-containing protein n=1 Tax=Marinomonas profundi TaxID=2726122 RepID=A0A847R2H5_9GAMM|nr:hypothetical protein [Marinomonas profundi]NLQ18002.1 hypothetical protein [Marinomonas profundi]UDV01726.1 hypothetical protein J8N69_08850 [Marinomonas profundi]
MSFKSLKEKTAKLKPWQWFGLLYIIGFIAIICLSYGIKLMITGLP